MSMFSKRHYEAVAEVLRRAPLTEIERAIVVGAFANKFAADNAKFNRSKFVQAATP